MQSNLAGRSSSVDQCVENHSLYDPLTAPTALRSFSWLRAVALPGVPADGGPGDQGLQAYTGFYTRNNYAEAAASSQQTCASESAFS